MKDEDVRGSSLIRKLAEVMAVVERIPKRGYNAFHKYDYATESDIVEAIRKEFVKHKIVMIPSVVSETREPVGDKGMVLTSLGMKFAFFDGETGDNQEFEWRGFGTDKEDKGGYKAMTGGLKYFLLKTFLLPTGDDPEGHQEEPVYAQSNNHVEHNSAYNFPGAVDRLRVEEVVVVEEPAGYRDFFTSLTAAAANGGDALKKAWEDGTQEWRKHVHKVDRERWEELKKKSVGK